MAALMTGPAFSGIRRRVENSQSPTCKSCGPWWRLPLLLGVVLAAILWSRGRFLRKAPPENIQDQPGPVADAHPGDSVSLAIDFGGGRRKSFDAVKWRKGMTVANLLPPAPDVEIVQRGAGEAAFLVAIDGVSNEGTSGRNWTYTVNGQSADRSFAVYKLQPGDRVLWTFGPSR